MLGGIGAATQQAALMGERAAQSQAQTQLGALSQLGQAELSTQRLRENRYQRELAQQRQLRAQAEAGAGAGLGNIIGGALSAGTIGLGAAGALGGDIKKAMLGDFTKDEGTGEEPTGADTFIPKVFPKTLGLQTAIAGRQPTNKELVQQDIRMGVYPEGYKEGGVMKTNGEFSHEKNPIDLVQNGEKVGEATGGEYIFNPQQSRKMNELAKKATEGGSKSQKANAMQKLAKFVRTTLKRFEKDLG